MSSYNRIFYDFFDMLGFVYFRGYGYPRSNLFRSTSFL